MDARLESDRSSLPSQIALIHLGCPLGLLTDLTRTKMASPKCKMRPLYGTCTNRSKGVSPCSTLNLVRIQDECLHAHECNASPVLTVIPLACSRLDSKMFACCRRISTDCSAAPLLAWDPAGVCSTSVFKPRRLRASRTMDWSLMQVGSASLRRRTRS